MTSRWMVASVASVIVACGGSSAPQPSGNSGTPPGTTAGTSPYLAGSWTWVEVPETACSDGSSTGFAVNPGDQPDVVVFLNGGGACWDSLSCNATLPTAAPGPFHAPQFAVVPSLLTGTFLDRAAPGNPFAHWTYVFIPYCTGDLHAGDHVATYSTRTWWHHGRVNIAADLALLAPAFPGTRRLIVGGSSAGGFGSLLQYDAIRAAWGAQTTFLIDDSGPPLEGDALSPALRAAWRSAWNLDPLLGNPANICPTCQDDFSQIAPQLAQRYPQDRMALLSSVQDQVIRGYFGLSADAFQTDLLATVHDQLDRLPSFHTFLVTGQDHALLARPASYTAGGTPLATWLTQMVEEDAAWRSAGP